MATTIDPRQFEPDPQTTVERPQPTGRPVGSRYCAGCRTVALQRLHQPERVTRRTTIAEYCVECDTCGRLGRPATDEFVMAEVPGHVWHPSYQRRSLLGEGLAAVSLLAIVAIVLAAVAFMATTL